MDNGEIADSVDVSDVSEDIDRVTLHQNGSTYRAAAFVEDGHGFREADVDLTEYPAVVTIASRAFDTELPVQFEPPATIAPGGWEDTDVD